MIPVVPKKYTILNKRCSILKIDMLMKFVSFDRKKLNFDLDTNV